MFASLALREPARRHAEVLCDAGGLAVAAIAIQPYSTGIPTPDLSAFWELVLLAAGLGLVAFGALDRSPGPAYVGVLNLILFIVSAASGTTLLVWPLFLLVGRRDHARRRPAPAQSAPAGARPVPGGGGAARGPRYPPTRYSRLTAPGVVTPSSASVRATSTPQPRERLHQRVLAARGQGEAHRPPDQHRPGAQRERLHDVPAALEPTVDEHLDPPADRLDHVREHFDGAELRIELAPAVVGHHERRHTRFQRQPRVLRVRHALEQQRQLGLLGEPRDLAPGQLRLQLAPGAAREVRLRLRLPAVEPVPQLPLAQPVDRAVHRHADRPVARALGPPEQVERPRA